MKGRTIGNAQASIELTQALLEELPESPLNTLMLIGARVMHGELLTIKEEHTAARKQVESANILMQDLQAQRPVAKEVKLMVL